MYKVIATIACLCLSTGIFAQSTQDQPKLLFSPAQVLQNNLVASSPVANTDCAEDIYSPEPGSGILDSKGALANSEASKKKKSRKSNFKGGAVAYSTALGIRGGGETGVSFKHFFKSNAGIEAIASTSWRYGGTRLTVLYEVQRAITSSSGLYWFWGVGGHAGLYQESYWQKGDCNDGSYTYKGKSYNCNDARPVAGFDGILGIEYYFHEIPFTIGFDVKPFIDIVGEGGHYTDAALSIRYVF